MVPVIIKKSLLYNKRILVTGCPPSGNLKHWPAILFIKEIQRFSWKHFRKVDNVLTMLTDLNPFAYLFLTPSGTEEIHYFQTVYKGVSITIVSLYKKLVLKQKLVLNLLHHL